MAEVYPFEARESGMGQTPYLAYTAWRKRNQDIQFEGRPWERYGNWWVRFHPHNGSALAVRVDGLIEYREF